MQQRTGATDADLVKKDDGPEARQSLGGGSDRRRSDGKTGADEARRKLQSEVPQVSSAEDIIGDLMGAKDGITLWGISLVPQKWLRIEHSGAVDEKARKEKRNVAEVCRWPVSNGAV